MKYIITFLLLLNYGYAQVTLPARSKAVLEITASGSTITKIQPLDCKTKDTIRGIIFYHHNEGWNNGQAWDHGYYIRTECDWANPIRAHDLTFIPGINKELGKYNEGFRGYDFKRIPGKDVYAFIVFWNDSLNVSNRKGVPYGVDSVFYNRFIAPLSKRKDKHP